MMKMVRFFSLIACLVLLVPALFACRSTQPPAPTSSPKPVPTTAAKPTPAVKPAPAPSPSPTVAVKPSPKPAAKPILIGITEDSSGFSRDAGTASMEGAILAIEEWNAKGGIRGTKVEYVSRDNAGDPAKAATIAREFVQMGAVAVIGGTSSTVAIPESKAFSQARIPFMTGSAAMEIFQKAPADGKIYGFTASGTNDLMVESVLRDMVKQGFKKFAILISNVAWPKDLAAITRELVAKKYGPQHGMEIAGEIALDVNATDVAAEVIKLKNLKFDAIFSSMYPGNAYAYARALATIGWRPPPRTYVLWALTQSTWRIHEKSLFANMRMYDLYNPAKTAAVKKRGEFMIRWGHEPVSEGHWVMAYDNANVLMTAINAAGPDPVAIRNWLETKAKGLPIIAGAIDAKADFSMDTLHSLSDVDHLYFFADLDDKGGVVYK